MLVLSVLFCAAVPLSWPLEPSASTLGRLAPLHHFSTIRSHIDRAALLSNRRQSCTNGGEAATAPKADPLIRIAAYAGADPTGKRDSSVAFGVAMADALRRGPGLLMGDNVTDLGGVVLDLEGGDYLVSAPIIVPPMVGNLRFQRGTIRAAPSFPAASYLIEVGSAECSEGGQGCCNEHLGFENLVLDASHVALGGLRINNTMDSVVGPHMLFLGFVEAGLAIHGGHENTISHAWFGQYYYDDPRWVNGTGKGIWLAGPDSVISQVVVFSARIGVHVQGWLNAITNVHTWNLHTPFGGIGIFVEGSSNRFDSNYLDCNAMYLHGVIDTDISNTFFLSYANLVLAPGGEIPGQTSIHGVRVVGSLFESSDGNTSVVLDERQQAFTAVTDTVIERGAARVVDGPGRRLLGTRATQKLPVANATTRFEFDFSDVLVFGSIREVRYSLSLDTGMFARSAARWTPGTSSVVIETDEAVSGTCIVDVDESERDKW